MINPATPKQPEKVHHFKKDTFICCTNINNKILLLLVIFFIILMNVLITLRMWKKIEKDLTLKVWDISEILIICGSLIGIFSCKIKHLQQTLTLILFSLLLFIVNGIIQARLEMQEFLKSHSWKTNKMKVIAFVSLIALIIGIGCTLRVWIVDQISKTIDSMIVQKKTKQNEYYYENDRAKMTIPEIKLQEAVDPDIVN